MLFCLALAAAAMAFALVLTPLIRALALRIGALDQPGERKIHRRAVPRLGGAAIFPAFIGALGAAALYHLASGRGLPIPSSWLVVLAIGGAAIVAVGWFDDRRSLSPGAKLSVQVVVAAFVCVNGFVVHEVTVPFAGKVDLGLLAIPLTIAWIVGITNALNLIDGMDGLGAGVAFIAATSSWLISAYIGDHASALFFACLSGACLGFLRYNLTPASIFLGDSGSLFLGFVLAFLSIAGSTKAAITVTVLAPLFVLGLPILDTALAIIRRTTRVRNEGRRNGSSESVVRAVCASDREHIHHRILWWGLNDRQAVVVLYGICGLLGALAFACIVAKDRGVALILVYVAALFWIGLRKLSFGWSGGAGIRGAELCGRMRRAAMSRSALICHGDAPLRDLATQALEGLGMSVSRVSTAQEAVTLSRTRPFDLVLVDVTRSNDAEMGLFERLKELNRGGVFIVLTGFEGFDRAAQALRRGAYDYLENPPNPDRVRHVLNRACERAWLVSRARFAASLLWLTIMTLPVAALVVADLVKG